MIVAGHCKSRLENLHTLKNLPPVHVGWLSLLLKVVDALHERAGD